MEKLDTCCGRVDFLCPGILLANVWRWMMGWTDSMPASVTIWMSETIILECHMALSRQVTVYACQTTKQNCASKKGRGVCFMVNKTHTLNELLCFASYWSFII